MKIRKTLFRRWASAPSPPSRRVTHSTSTSTTRASPVAVARPQRATPTRRRSSSTPAASPIAEGTQRRARRLALRRAGLVRARGPGDKTRRTPAPPIVPQLYVTSRVHDMVAVGLGLHFPFGLAVSWPTGHPQADVIQDQTLRTYFITPVGRRQPQQAGARSLDRRRRSTSCPRRSSSSAPSSFGDVAGHRACSAATPSASAAAPASCTTRPRSRASRSASMYRSQVKLDFEGNGDFDIAEPYRAQLPPDGDDHDDDHAAAVDLRRRRVLADPEPRASSSTSVWINWANAFGTTSSVIDLPDDGNLASRARVGPPQNYKNTVTYRLGARVPRSPTQQRDAARGLHLRPDADPDDDADGAAARREPQERHARRQLRRSRPTTPCTSACSG